MCCVTGYIGSKIYTSKTFEKIIEKLGIYRTVNNGIWNDIMDGGRPIWIQATLKNLNEEIYGEVYLAEMNNRYPIVVLRRYEVCDLDGEKIKDFENDYSKFYVLDTSKCDKIEYVYADIDKTGEKKDWLVSE